MGVIDSKIFILSCPKCNEKEEQKVLDKGSGWEGSSWPFTVNFNKFDIEFQGGGKEDPEITFARCKNCGCEVININRDYKVQSPLKIIIGEHGYEYLQKASCKCAMLGQSAKL